MAQVGTRGERLDLIVRQGATLGPHTVTLTNPDGSAVNLTGCTIQGQVRKDPLDTGMPVAPVVSNLKAWNGSSWVPGIMKRWNGTSWDIIPLKRWNGSAWV